VDGAIVTRWKVLEGNPNDDRQWLPGLDHHIERFGNHHGKPVVIVVCILPVNERRSRARRPTRDLTPARQKIRKRRQHEDQPWSCVARKWHVGLKDALACSNDAMN